MNNLLILTSRDFARFANTRIRHLTHHLANLFEETTVVFRCHQVTPSNPWRSFWRLQLRVYQKERLKLVEVDPLGARPHGLASRLLKITNPFEQKPPGGKRLLQEGLSLLGGISDLLLLPSLLLAFRRACAPRYRIILAQGPFEALCGALLKKWGRAVFLVCDDADYEPGFAPTRARRALIRWAEKTGIRRADLVVSVGHMLAERRRREYGLKNVVVIPNGVDYSIFSQAQIKKPSAHYTLLYMGYLGGWSGLDLLLAALVLLKKEKHPLPRLLLAGHLDPFYFEAWKEKAHKQNISFSYLGRFPYHKLTVPLEQAVLGWAVFPPIPLRRYAFPLKAVEYMAAGLAVLATKDTEAGLLINSHQAGYVLPYQKEIVAETLKNVYRNPEEVESYRRRGAEAARQYDWKKILKKYSALIKENFHLNGRP